MEGLHGDAFDELVGAIGGVFDIFGEFVAETFHVADFLMLIRRS